MVYRHGPVVVGVDGSPHGTGALRWAADEACRHTSMLLVVHAVRPGLGGYDRDGIVRAAVDEARRWRVGVAATGSTEAGPADEVLRRYSAGARLLVVGGHGGDPAGPAAKAIGSVSRALGDHAECPVLIVHNAQRWAAPDAVLPRTGAGSGAIAVGFDGSDAARRALRLAFEEAAGHGRPLVIVRAWPHPDLWRPGQLHGADLCADETAVREALRSAAAPWRARYPNVDVEIRSQPGDVVEALALASQRAAVMVLGARCAADCSEPADPPILHRLLRHVACPVLVAHGPGQPLVAPGPGPGRAPGSISPSGGPP